MNFDAKHYVPVLQVKRGEKAALLELSTISSYRNKIIPLLEIVERNPENSPDVESHLDKAFNKLDIAVRGYARVLLDARKIADDGPAAATEVFQRAAKASFQFTPVTGISRTADVRAALRHRKNGVCVRVTRSEFEDGNLARNLGAFLTRHGLTPPEADLIVDLGPVENLIQEGIAALTTEFIAEIPDHSSWRTFTISACAFPMSMRVVDRNSYDQIERSDWKAWRDGLCANRDELERLPAFSDYAIQHPRGVEGFDPRIMQVSATVRYTLEEAWLLIKGEGTRVVPATSQFPDLAFQLVYGHLRPHFKGADHCPGCERIKKAADGEPRLGSAEVWRRLGTIHHLAMVVDGLTELPLP